MGAFDTGMVVTCPVGLERLGWNGRPIAFHRGTWYKDRYRYGDMKSGRRRKWRAGIGPRRGENAGGGRAPMGWSSST
jgi:hypothetical protein